MLLVHTEKICILNGIFTFGKTEKDSSVFGKRKAGPKLGFQRLIVTYRWLINSTLI